MPTHSGARGEAVERASEEGIERLEAGTVLRFGKLQVVLALQFGLDEGMNRGTARSGVLLRPGPLSVEESVDGRPEIGVESAASARRLNSTGTGPRSCSTHRTARSARRT